jgi:hypothetical protein
MTFVTREKKEIHGHKNKNWKYKNEIEDRSYLSTSCLRVELTSTLKDGTKAPVLDGVQSRRPIGRRSFGRRLIFWTTGTCCFKRKITAIAGKFGLSYVL